MDGLECSEIRMSDVCDTTTLRFDSDYYKKEYLEIEQFICKNRDKFVTIESQGLQVDASAFYPSLEPYYNTGTIPFVRVADVKDQIEYNACVNIPEMEAKKAQEASAAKSRFLFSMSHDIRTPMNAIMGYTELMEKNVGNIEKEKDYFCK